MALFNWHFEEDECFLLNNQLGMSEVFPLVMWTNSVLSVTQLGRDHSSSIIIHHSAFIIVHSAFIICHEAFNNQWTIDNKSIKSQSKINKKSFQNQPKSVLEPPGGVLEASKPSWSRHGGVQGPLKSEQLILLSLSNEMAILAKNGDFVREWEQVQK